MKRARIGMVAIAALAVATVAFAQAKPDFSGTWAPDQPARRRRRRRLAAARRAVVAAAAAGAAVGR